ncbi:MAG: plasmid stabilization protein [Hoeflea sp.]|nr:plasmid stabilization protein [Hoeflea sp.]
MSDLLIRDLPEPMRAEIRKAAASSGRSLSEEAKHLIRKGLTTIEEGLGQAHSAWDEIREALGEARLSDDEHAQLLAATAGTRRSAARETPEFE